MVKPATDLIPHLLAFRGFVRRRISDPQTADDLVQESLLKAVRSAGQLRDTDALLPWFYRILRNAITDHHRRSAVTRRALELVADEPQFDAEDNAEACACLGALVESLKPEYAQLIREMDLGGASLDDMSVRLGVSKTNLKVRHHRARKRLRTLLERTCRTCAAHGCVDCDCEATG